MGKYIEDGSINLFIPAGNWGRGKTWTRERRIDYYIYYLLIIANKEGNLLRKICFNFISEFDFDTILMLKTRKRESNFIESHSESQNKVRYNFTHIAASPLSSSISTLTCFWTYLSSSSPGNLAISLSRSCSFRSASSIRGCSTGSLHTKKDLGASFPLDCDERCSPPKESPSYSRDLPSRLVSFISSYFSFQLSLP